MPSGPYSPQRAIDDIPGISYALHLFLASHMVESEDYCKKYDPNMERLYFATGYGLIQFVKGMMSFEDEDLLSAINHVRHGNIIASQHRKRTASLPTRLVGLVVGSLNTSGVGFIKSMTAVERHAELVYAESLFEKSLLGIVYSGDWLAFIKDALNLRTTINIYRQLGKYLEIVDAEAQARGKGPEDSSIDAHFRSGVYLGVDGLDWRIWKEPVGGRRNRRNQRLGLRKRAFTFEGVDIMMAQKILNYHKKRYPNGVFFLFGQGRLHLCQSQPALAIECYQRAMQVQNQYRNMYNISHWEMAVANLALWDISASLECWRNLASDATWSKATYTYGIAVCLLELGGDKNCEEAGSLMEKVPNLRQRIAGKSIPLEKFVARKARKFKHQGGRLVLPALEFAYLFLGITHMPRSIIVTKVLPLIDEVLLKLKAHENDPSMYEDGTSYWDDLCLANFLKGNCLRYIAYPDPDAVIDNLEKIDIPSDAEESALAAFESVFTDGTKISLDHYLVYYAHYEYARLLACKGDRESARKHLELVLSGKPLEISAAARKGKYSMENALHVRAHAALEALDQNRSL
ncbi:Tetratricopeptide repeat protein 39B [Grifola frondosa]|uniref:Tetratricopeptide repeat protein 39B n=1 Tax=Grifola frondosa TaxID=5627 RepID=A0A1C7MDE2_GRIFR|nr:Tetratricopeptide repeat protein 39B [Grifola frondosa]